MIDFLYKKIDGTNTFTWKEALFLPQWDVYAFPSNKDIYKNIINTAKTMDLIMELINDPIIIHCWYRPPLYNKLVKGAQLSQHKLGLAVDFSFHNKSCEEAKSIIKQKLDRLKIRMENNPGANWIHIDLREPGEGGRFFNP